jgi:pyrroloquinoline quinone biosynthesis protein B
LTPQIRGRIRGAGLLFFDGTLWHDDEMIAAGVGSKTGQRMGHMSMSGLQGSIAVLGDLGIRRKIFIHINNTNPALLPDSAERAQLAGAGWEVAGDGDEIAL